MTNLNYSGGTRLRLHLMMGCLGLLLAGCRVGPNYAPPSTPVPDLWHQELQAGEFVSSEELGQWWLLFEDPLLHELIDVAGQQNLDLYVAYQRIQQAQAQRSIAAADKWPNFNLSRELQNLNGFAIFGGGAGTPFDIWRRSLDLSWEIDVFGRVQRQIESADASLDAQVEAYRDVMVRLYGDVGQAYVQIRTLQKQLEYARQNVDLQEKALELARRRVEGGIAPNLDLFEAQRTLGSTEAAIPPITVELHRAMNRLAVLLGTYPGSLHEELAAVAPIPAVPVRLPLVVPCEMVRQRPDIRQAERQVATRTAEVGVAISDLYPRFRLNGQVGFASSQFGQLISGDSFVYSVGPAMTWATFQAGRIRCNIARTESAVEEALATYESTLIRAAEEVENAVVGFREELERREALERTVEAAKNSLESSLALYREGKTDFQAVLLSQLTLFENQNNLAISEGQIINQLILLYRALGGGWDPAHHCPERVVRLFCPARGDAEAVEQIPVPEAGERYFDLAPAQVRDREGTLDLGPLPPLQAPSSLPATPLSPPTEGWDPGSAP